MKKISTLDELFHFIHEYSYKKWFFRGEYKDYGKTACLPSKLRKNGFSGDGDWFTEKLEALGVGTPYMLPCGGDSDDAIIKNALLNTTSQCWRVWGEEKLEALMKHYIPDLNPLEDLGLIKKNGLELSGASFSSTYLDITLDIMVALHFACSEFKWGKKDKVLPEIEEVANGYIFVFDPNKIANAQYLKLVSYPSYTYFYKKEGKYYFQPFDRITHQRGAFLAPKRNKKGEIFFNNIENEMKGLYKKFTIKSNVKQKLFEIFGGKEGMDYYFPKIPLVTPVTEDIRYAYENLKGLALLE